MNFRDGLFLAFFVGEFYNCFVIDCWDKSNEFGVKVYRVRQFACSFCASAGYFVDFVFVFGHVRKPFFFVSCA